MQVNNTHYNTLWFNSEQQCVCIIDQTRLPHHFEIVELRSTAEFCHAIAAMQVRGAPLIGITAAFGLALSIREDSSDQAIQATAGKLLGTRPTAINLQWAIEQILQATTSINAKQRLSIALERAEQLRNQDIATCESIGDQGVNLLEELHKQKNDGKQALNILTHCNAGWLATIDWGTALAPIYKAQQLDIPLHIWVSETRPRNQGASLTAWELSQQGIAHTVIADNTAGHLMQQGLVDVCLVGSDRTTASGDVCNKIGTYLKALAAQDNQVPFYVALPTSTFDWTIDDGIQNIPIEQRDSREITHISGLDTQGQQSEIQLVANSPAANYAFDVTPASLITGLVTEHGIFNANKASLKKLKKLAVNN